MIMQTDVDDVVDAVNIVDAVDDDAVVANVDVDGVDYTSSLAYACCL